MDSSVVESQEELAEGYRQFRKGSASLEHCDVDYLQWPILRAG